MVLTSEEEEEAEGSLVVDPLFDYLDVDAGQVREAAVEHAAACVELLLLRGNLESHAPDEVYSRVRNLTLNRNSSLSKARRRLVTARKVISIGVRVASTAAAAARFAAVWPALTSNLL